MSPFTFLRTSSRRRVLTLLAVGGVMTMSPVSAALSSSVAAEQGPFAATASATPASTDAGSGLLGDELLGGELLGGELLGGELLGGDPVADLLGGGLPGADLLGDDLVGDALGGDLLGGDLLGGLPGGDLLGGDLLDGGLPSGLVGGGGDQDPPGSAAEVNDAQDADEGGISIAGIHLGMSGHLNSVEELLDPCDSLTGRIHTGIQGADLLFRPALPAPTPCPDPAPPVNNPGSPTVPPGTGPGTDVLQAAIDQPGPGRLFPAPQAASPTPAVASAPSDGIPMAVAGAPGHRGALPRTGPGLSFPGPVALALLGLSGALRAAIGRRRPVLS